MKKYLYSFTLWISLLFLGLAGCKTASESPVTPTVTKTATSAPINIATLTPAKTSLLTRTLTLTPFQLALPMVTLSSQEAEKSLLELLRTNGNCTGKCVTGIYPDDMTVQEAVNVMAQWGGVEIVENWQGKTFIHLIQAQLYEQVFVKLSIGTWTEKLVTIDKVSVHIAGPPGDWILGEEVWLANQDTWKGMRLDTLLKTYGVPSYVGYFFQTAVEAESPQEGKVIIYDMEMQYEQINLEISIGAMAHYDGENVFLCPSKDSHDLGIQINPERSLIERQEFRPVTWQALTGTDLDAFYQIFTGETNLDACVTTTLEQIQELQPYFR